MINAAQDEAEHRLHQEVATLCRHFPGPERAMLAVWHHVTQTDDVTPCGICERD